MWILWLVFAALLIAGEVLTTGFFLLWFGVGAAVAAVTIVFLPKGGSPQILLRKHVQSEAFLRGHPVDYVTAMNEYLPVFVKRQEGPFDPVARALPPEGGAIHLREKRPGFYRVGLSAKSPVVLELNAHYYPGWRAFLDGKPVSIGPLGQAPLSASGLVRVPVPEGDHEVRIEFGRTPLRLALDLVSLAALLVGLGMLVGAWHTRRLLRP